jgi:hypothetical protein
MPDKRTCRDCVHFKYPEPSSFMDNVTVTYYCPHACHQWSGGLGYTTAGMPACRHYEKKTQLTLF